MPKRQRRGQPTNIFDMDARTRVATRGNRRAQEAKRRPLRSDIPGTRSPASQPSLGTPDLTAPLAYEFVKLLQSGLPPLVALSYMLPDRYRATGGKQRKNWVNEWMRHPLTLTATTTLNKGAWPDLDPDDRLTIALDKHLAERAYLLYANVYATADGLLLKKMDDAYQALTDRLKEQDGGQETPWMKAMRDLLGGQIGDAYGPPQLKVGDAVPVERTTKES